MEEKQIKELNELVKIKIAPSKVHGVGVFAIRDLKKGEKLYSDIAPIAYKIRYESMDKLMPNVRDLLLGQWPNIINGSIFFYPTLRFQAFMNHSYDPNYSAMNDEVTKDIKAGEEIFENYLFINNSQQIFPWLKN